MEETRVFSGPLLRGLNVSWIVSRLTGRRNDHGHTTSSRLERLPPSAYVKAELAL